MADLSITTTIEGVESKVTGTGKNRYSVKTANGKFSTFDDKVGAKAMTLGGKAVDITYYESSQEANGQTYTYKNIKTLSEATGATQGQAPSGNTTGGYNKPNERSFYYAYAKDIFVALLAAGIMKRNPTAAEVASYGDELWFMSGLPYPKETKPAAKEAPDDDPLEGIDLGDDQP